MAQGDAVYLPAATGYTGTVNFQPSSGVEYCITSAVGGSYSYMQWINSAGNFDTNTSGNHQFKLGGIVSMTHVGEKLGISHQFFNNTYYPRHYTANSGTYRSALIGIQSK